MTENSDPEAPPDGKGASKQKRDWFEKATLWTAIVGVIVVAASTWIAGRTAHIIRGQLDEMKSSDPVLLAQSNAAVSLSQTALAQLVSAGKLADAAADQSRAAKDQVVQMRAAVAAAQAQVGAAQATSQALTKQLGVQQAVFGETFRPRIKALITNIGALSVGETEIRGQVTFTFPNTGNVTAQSVEHEVEMTPLRDALRTQRDACNWTDLRLAGLAKQAGTDSVLSVVGDVPAGQGSPDTVTYDVVDKALKYRRPMTPIRPDGTIPSDFHQADKFVDAALVGCVSYRNPNDLKVHHTRFVYYFLEEAEGGPTFMSNQPHQVALGRVILRRWPDGNTED